VPKVVVTTTAAKDLDALILSHNLSIDTKDRFRTAVRGLQRFPELGPALTGRWQGFRFVLGPWRWMLVVYRYDPAEDTVAIATVQDSRSRKSASST